MKKYLLIFLISLICFSSLSPVFAQISLEQSPLDGEEKTMIKQGIETLKKTLRGVLAAWKGAHQRVTEYWRENVLPRVQQWFEEKKPIIKKEFEEEKEELKKGLSKTFSKFWKWLKDLVR